MRVDGATLGSMGSRSPERRVGSRTIMEGRPLLVLLLPVLESPKVQSIAALLEYVQVVQSLENNSCRQHSIRTNKEERTAEICYVVFTVYIDANLLDSHLMSGHTSTPCKWEGRCSLCASLATALRHQYRTIGRKERLAAGVPRFSRRDGHDGKPSRM